MMGSPMIRSMATDEWRDGLLVWERTKERERWRVVERDNNSCRGGESCVRILEKCFTFVSMVKYFIQLFFGFFYDWKYFIGD